MQAKTRYNLWSGARVLAVATILSGTASCGYAFRKYDGKLGELYQAKNELENFNPESKEYTNLQEERTRLAKDPELLGEVSERTYYGLAGCLLFFGGISGLMTANLMKRSAITDMRLEEYARNRGIL